MTDVATLHALDALLATHGGRLKEWQLTLPVGANRDALLAGLLRILVGRTVKVESAPHAPVAAGNCRDCGAEILFIKRAKTDKWIPTDRHPRLGATDDGSVVRIREAHHATCANASARAAREAKKAQAEHEQRARAAGAKS